MSLGVVPALRAFEFGALRRVVALPSLHPPDELA